MRRWARRLALGLLIAVGAAVGLVGVLLALASSGPGEKLLLARLLPLVNEAIPGELELEGLDLAGTSIGLTNVTLRDPEGDVVAKVERLEASLALRPLLHKEVNLQHVRVVRPELRLALDGRGLNLLRAVTKDRPPEEKPSAKSSLVVRVGELELEGGQIDFDQSELDALARRFHVNELTVKGGLVLTNPGARLQSTLELRGRLTQPTEGPLSLVATLDTHQVPGQAELKLEVAGIQLEASGSAQDLDNASASLSRLVVPHAAARAVLPLYPLVADLSATGKLDQRAGKATLSLEAEAADAALRVAGTVDLYRLRADELRVEADALDFSKLVEKGPASKLSLRLLASGGGTSLASLDGSVELTIPQASLDGQSFGPIELQGHAKAGRFELSRLDVKLPGATLAAEGSGTPERIRISGSLRAQDLARTGRTLGRVVDPKGVSVAGKGTLSFVVAGPPQHPGVSLRGRFPMLQYADLAVRDLTFEGTLPDVLRPLDSDVDLRAGTLQLGERSFDNVRTSLVTRGRELTADITAEGFNEIELHLRGTADPDRQGFALADLRLRYPEATWTLERPTRLTLARGRVLVDELALASSGQRLVLSGGIRGTQLQAAARIEQLRLDRLPKAFVPESLGLGGALDAQLSVQGATGKPRVDAKVRLDGGAIGPVRELQLSLDARYADDRVQGELSARALTADVKASFDAPITGLQKGTREPLALDVSVAPTRLEALFSALGTDPRLTGMASARVKVSGTAAQPHVRIEVDGDEVKHASGPAGDLRLVAESNPGGKLLARVDLNSMGGQSHVLLQTPFTAAQFLREPVKGRMFLETPVQLEGSFREFPVAALAAWGVVDESLKGKASFTVEASGPVIAPEGKVHLAVKAVASGELEPVDLFGTLTANAGRIELTATALRKQQRIVDLAAKVGTSVGELLRRAPVDDVSISADGDFGPIDLPELQALTGMTLAEEKVRRPSGLVHAKLKVDGTLADPIATLKVSAEKLGMGKLALGSITLDYAYEAALSRANVALTSERGGALLVEGETRLDLSLPGLRSGIDWSEAPVKARLASEGFDPSFLSNVTSFVRSIAGRIDANATLNGTLGAPRPNGRIEWSEGKLALAGYGNFQDVHLLVRGTRDQIVLEDLSAQGGGGRLKLTARADRAGEKVYLLDGSGELNQFPTIVDDQLKALLTGRFLLSGKVDGLHVSIRDLVIPEMHVELPEVRSKNLQPLDRPAGIELVRSGVPLYRDRSADRSATHAKAAAEALTDTTDGNTANEEGLRFTVIVNAPRNIWVKGTDLNTELRLSDGFSIDVADRAMMRGEIRFLQGRVDVLGRRFEVLKDSQVTFNGPPGAPHINIVAQHTNEREQVSVFTTVRGQGSDLSIKVNSKPALSESEIYTLLATGGRTLKRGSGASMGGAEAATVATAYMASQLKRAIGTKIPLDVSIEAGENGLADASGAAGMYITDDLYVSYQLRPGADEHRRENKHSFRLEYQLTPRWSLETDYGLDTLSGGADVIWSKDY